MKEDDLYNKLILFLRIILVVLIRKNTETQGFSWSEKVIIIAEDGDKRTLQPTDNCTHIFCGRSCKCGLSVPTPWSDQSKTYGPPIPSHQFKRMAAAISRFFFLYWIITSSNHVLFFPLETSLYKPHSPPVGSCHSISLLPFTHTKKFY